ncbi:MAG TPA: hypothetical protein VJ842_12590 [Pyrinomonadaceae bacterium]|nr:hypothetical protein [Pyrinomonadaceae bacterium]
MKNRLGFALALVFTLVLGTSAALANVKQTSSNQSSMTANKSASTGSKRRSKHRKHHRHHQTARAKKTDGNKNTRS